MRKWIIVGFLVFGVAGVAVAQEKGDGEATDVASVAGIAQTSAGNVTLDFKDADITNVLRILSYKSGINIVAGKDVTGPVTIRLTDVPWQKALEVILRTYGYTYEREENIIRVTTTENLEKEELVTEVFALNYADAENIPAAIEEMLSDRGSIKYDERANLVIVTDIPTNIYKIKQVIERLDMRTKQVNIEAKIVETTLDKDDNLGIRWTMQATASMAKRPTTFPFDRKAGGGSWYPISDPSGASSTSSPVVGTFPSNVGTGFPMALPTNFTLGTLDFSAFQAVLEILKSRSDTKIISNPRITTLDNQEARIVVATTFSIPTYERNDSTGNIEVTGYSEKELGVTLSVTPQINPEGFVVVKLEPEVSTFLDWDTFTSGSSGSIQAPRFSTRKASTQVMVKNGETIVIGGLIKENIVDAVYKVPILGDIPILSLFFKKKEKSVETTDLMFFITVNIVDPEANATAVAVTK
ncbi:MAG: type IV pilus secretin PilQ [Candidatus Omnitrophica bacterium]|nr:type IV pilus secretin PilQ [Candidatus Omnitrophota bacterium]MBU4590037.1 type IV pilus secretin PilQ [Candidatus Omnitrophota bacterium]